MDHNSLVRQVVQRPVATVNKAYSSKSILSGLSTKSSPDLGISIPGTVGQNGQKMPLKTQSNL